MTQVTSDVLVVADLFNKGRFDVPWHQRYYDWTVEQVAELLLDLTEAIDETRTSYFLGSIMLVEGKNRVWEINDGQQRLITLSLLIAALCRRFATRRRTDAARELLALRLLFVRDETAVGSLDDTSRDTPRVKPPRQDRSRFTQIIRGHDIGTNGKMTSAWNEIQTFVAGLTLQAARPFFDFLVRNVEIGVLFVPRSEDANAVFEALNGRGKQLDDVDLIRNHLYSYFTDAMDTERRATVHESLESVLLNNRTTQRTQDYFRCYFQCRFGYLQKNRFYRETRAKIRASSTRRRKAGDAVYGLVADLADRRFVELFRTITATNPSSEFLAAFMRASSTTNRKRNLRVLLSELRGYKVAHPLVFALLRKFVEAQGPDRKTVARAVHRSLNDLASFVVRVSFCEAKFEPSRFETAFANAATRVMAAGEAAAVDVQTDLQECDERRVLEDARFTAQLASVELRDAKRAKRLLFGVNAHLDREAKALDFDGCTVEHILPQANAHWPGWTEFTDLGQDTRNWVYRIGNLTLLGDSETFARTHFNANFDAKRSAFGESPFAITRRLAAVPKWNPPTIADRSTEFANAAAQVWSISRPTRSS